jgi:riboflavin synthase
MFTGLVRSTGVVAHLGENTLTVAAPQTHGSGLEGISLGASVSINGCCLTVTQIEVDDDDGVDVRYSFDLMPHTLEHTALGSLSRGARVNIEPALRAGDPLGGHMVQGHVDGVGVVSNTQSNDNALIVEITVPADVHRYCIPRGSVTVNGVSLTVIDLKESAISVSLIPETRQRTMLGELVAGDRVNLEADVIARYVESLLPRA